MVSTIKFSEFAAGGTIVAGEEVVGVQGGLNTIFDTPPQFIDNFTNASRPATIDSTAGMIGYNTDVDAFQYFDGTAWQTIGTSADLAAFIARLAAHTVSNGASLVGLQDQSGVSNKTVQDLANAAFIVKTNNSSMTNAQALGSLSTGILKSTTGTGLVSISAPLTSIDGLTTAPNEMIYTTGSNVYATTPLTALARSLLDDSTTAAMRTTLGLGSASTHDITFFLQAANNLSDVNSVPTARSNLGLGNAALKTVTDNTQTYVTSAKGLFTIGHVLLAGDSLGTVVDGGSPAGMGTVTNIATGTGLTGGPITTTGSIEFANINSGTILANITGSDNEPPIPNTLSDILDFTIGDDQGSIIYRGASDWEVLIPSTSGFFLKTQGAAANPIWADVTATSGTVSPGLVNQLAYYAASGSTVSGLATAANGLLVTSAGSVPSIATNIPTAVTIGGTYIYRVGGNDVALADGGTNASLTASNGGIFYSTATAGAILAGTATANQVLLSGASTTPAWSTAQYPATAGSSGNILTSDGTNWLSSAAPAAGPWVSGTGIGSAKGGDGTAVASGNYSASYGDGTNTASGVNAWAFGTANNVSGNTSAAFGNNCSIGDHHSYAFGNTHTIGSSNSFAYGRQNTCTGTYSMVGGYLSTSGADSTWTYGLGINNANQGCFVIGDSVASAATSSTVDQYVATYANGYRLYYRSGGVATLALEINSTGAVTTGTWHGSVVTGTYGGTGVNNGASTITIGGNVTFSGAFTFTGTITGNTSVTFPTSGTLATTSQIPAFPLSLANGGTNAALTASNGGIFYSTATAGAILSGTATAGQMLRSGATAAPTWSTATFPATATGTGTILRADGTNWVATTATYPATTTANQIFYSSATNVVGEITTAANGVLITSAGSVPSISSTLPAAVQANITNVGTLGSFTSSGTISNANQPGASVTVGSNQNNVTGDGTVYQVIWDTVPASGFNTGTIVNLTTGTITFPNTGKYLVTGILYISGLAVGHTSMQISIVTTGRSYPGWYGAPFTNTVSGEVQFPFTAIVTATAADTGSIKIIVSGSTKVVDILTGASFLQIWQLG